MPAISVIVPVYNVQEYIGRCIGSILGQTFADFELILVDDGSTDGSRGICADFARRDNRVVLLENDHKGVSAARNAGLDAARGEYITFVDGDDSIHPHFLEIIYNNRADLTVANYREVQATEKPDCSTVEVQAKTITPERSIERLFDDVCFMTVWGKLYSRTLIGGHRFEPMAMSEDLEFNSRVFVCAKDVVFVDNALYMWTVRNMSAVRSRFSERSLDTVRGTLKAYFNVAACGERCASFALRRLYKVIVALRYNGTDEYKDEIRSVNSEAIEKTHRAFLKNRYIGTGFKAVMTMFLKLPFTYSVFRYFATLGHK